MKVAIIGGGISGLTCAIAMKKKNVQCTVFERSPVLNEVGAGVWLAPNALKVFDLLGIKDEFQNMGYAYDKQIMIGKSTGEPSVIMKSEDFKIKYGSFTRAIHRAKLQEHLAEKVHDLQLGYELIDLNEMSDGVQLSFANGESRKYDAVIGADGIKSKVRDQLYDKVEFRNTGQICWRFVVKGDLPGMFNGSMMEMWGTKKGQRIGCGKVSEDLVYIFLTDRVEHKLKDLVTHFSEFPDYVLKLIEQGVKENQDIVNKLYDFKPIDKWFTSRTVLIGDAAHATIPNMGQGACQGIESAYAIAHYWDSTNLESGFDKFQSYRQEKTLGITKNSWRLGNLSNQASWIRNIALKLTALIPSSIMDKNNDRLYSLKQF